MHKLLNEKGIFLEKFHNERKKQNVDYDALRTAMKIDGLSNSREESSAKARASFIESMRVIHGGGVPKLKAIENSNKSVVKDMVVAKDTVEKTDGEREKHDVKLYTHLIHPVRKESEKDKPLRRRLARLSQLSSKQPFERSPAEVSAITSLLGCIRTLADQIDEEMMPMLAAIVQRDCHTEAEVPLFGSRGFYLVLGGYVRPLVTPHLRQVGEPVVRFLPARPDHDRSTLYPLLHPGDCFGTLDEIMPDSGDNVEEGTMKNTGASDVRFARLLLNKTGPTTTAEQPCELLYITTSYYRKTLEKYGSQRHADKLRLLRRQSSLSVWPEQPLVRVAAAVEWARLPAGTVLCREGEVAPHLAFVQSGRCFVLRRLRAVDTLANGRRVAREKQVLVGSIGPGQTYGEVSLLDGEPMRHTIISQDNLKVIQCGLDEINELDDDVRLLLRQSCSALFYDITQEEVEKRYVEQKADSDWTNFKESVITNIINEYQIRPGHGKWGSMATSGDVFE